VKSLPPGLPDVGGGRAGVDQQQGALGGAGIGQRGLQQIEERVEIVFTRRGYGDQAVDDVIAQVVTHGRSFRSSLSASYHSLPFPSEP
jgi:hypothetical protein